MRRQSYQKSYSAIHIKNTHKPAELEGVGNQRVECVSRLNNRETAQPELSSCFKCGFSPVFPPDGCDGAVHGQPSFRVLVWFNPLQRLLNDGGGDLGSKISTNQQNWNCSAAGGGYLAFSSTHIWVTCQPTIWMSQPTVDQQKRTWMRVAMQGKQGQKVVSLSSPPPLSPLTPPGKNTTAHLVQQIFVTLCNCEIILFLYEITFVTNLLQRMSILLWMKSIWDSNLHKSISLQLHRHLGKLNHEQSGRRQSKNDWQTE